MKGYLYVISAVSLWAIGSGVVAKTIEVSGLVLVSITSFFGALALLAKLAFDKKLSKLVFTDKHVFWFLIIIGLGVVFNNGLFYSAIKTTSVANAVLSHYLAPIFVVIFFAPLIIKEKISRMSIVAVLLGMLGLTLIIAPGFRGDSVDMGIVFGIGSALFFAIHTVFERKLASLAKVDLTVASFYKLVPSAILLLPFVFIHINNSGVISSSDWLKMLIMGVFFWAASFILLFRGYKTVSASSTSILFYLEPIIAIFLAFIFLKEGLNLFTILGGVLILASGTLVAIKEKNN